MVRSRNLPAWWLIGVGAFGGCRVGYDEIFVIDEDTGGEGGRGASGGTGGSSGGTGGSSGGTGGSSGDGEAGVDAAGGTSASGGSAGSEASAGSPMTGGESGAPASGGSAGAGAGESSGGAGGSSGGAAGTSAGSTSGGSAGSGDGGASAGSGTGGGLGSGGFAGVSSLGDCQTDSFGGHDYAFCNVNIAWTAARDNCASVGMFLVRVDDAAESQWVYDNLYDTAPRQGVWIGASDLASEGEWRWTDGALFWLGDSSGSAQNGLFSAWYASQPSGQEPRDCAALDGNALGWYDLDCSIPQPYACESP